MCCILCNGVVLFDEKENSKLSMNGENSTVDFISKILCAIWQRVTSLVSHCPGDQLLASNPIEQYFYVFVQGDGQSLMESQQLFSAGKVLCQLFSS